jgi:hypothetical protein
MKKLFLILLAVFLVSCGKVPQDKISTAEQCLDSLKSLGAENSAKFIQLKDSMKNIYADLEIEKSKLFKRFLPIRTRLDELISTARHFTITNDGYVNTSNSIKSVNPNVVRIEVQIDFDSPQDALSIASQVDDAVRRNLNTRAKLIRIKIIE